MPSVTPAGSLDVANVDAKTVCNALAIKVARDAHLMIDRSPVYDPSSKESKGHRIVDYSAEDYVTTGPLQTLQTAKNFFSIFNHSVIGTGHRMGKDYTGRCSSEFYLRSIPATLPTMSAFQLSLAAVSVAALPAGTRQGRRLSTRDG